MFYLEHKTLTDSNWKALTGKQHTSAGQAKTELKKLYDMAEIELPVPGCVRVVDTTGTPYFIYDGRDKGLRFRWIVAK